MIRLIASDLDGTLLSDRQMPVDAYEAIREVLDAGIVFVACSGRQYSNMLRLFWPVADRLSYVCENGALTVAEGKFIDKRPIPQADALAMAKDFMDLKMELLVSDVHSTYLFGTNKEYADSMVYSLKNACTIINCLEELPKEIIKVSGYIPEGLDEVAPILAAKWGQRYSATAGGPQWFDITLGSKASGLQTLCKHFGIDVADVAAFGDSFNDEPMLELVGHPHIMANADERMKKPHYRQTENVVEAYRRIARDRR